MMYADRRLKESRPDEAGTVREDADSLKPLIKTLKIRKTAITHTWNPNSQIAEARMFDALDAATLNIANPEPVATLDVVDLNL